MKGQIEGHCILGYNISLPLDCTCRLHTLENTAEQPFIPSRKSAHNVCQKIVYGRTYHTQRKRERKKVKGREEGGGFKSKLEVINISV